MTGRATGLDVGLVRVGTAPIVIPFLASAAAEFGATFSPDGKWVSYVSDQTGRAQAYIRRYPTGETLPVSVEPALGVAWSRDGRELFFDSERDGTSTMMAVSVTPQGETLRLGKPRPLFDMRFTSPTGEAQQYIGSRSSGRRFEVLSGGTLLLTRAADTDVTSREIVLVVQLRR